MRSNEASKDRLEEFSHKACVRLPSERAAVYARYSSDNQHESSIDQQVAQCRRKAEKDGVEIPGHLLFKDEAKSGADPNRPGFKAMLESARAGEFQLLYVENLSRLTRDLLIWTTAERELESLGIRIISISEGFDSSRQGASVEGTIRAVIHEEQRKTIASNVRRGLRDAVERGYSCGHYCFGYRSEPIPGTEYGRRGHASKVRMRVVIDEEQAAIVREVFDRYTNQGWPVARIVRDLNSRSVPKNHRATSSTWRHDDLLRLLRNEKYVGIWTFGKTERRRHPSTGKVTQRRRQAGSDEILIHRHPERRIVDQETFDRAQMRLEDSTKRYSGLRKRGGRLGGSMRGNAPPRHLLQGLIRCGKCGALFYTSGPKYMRCSAHLKGICDQRTGIDRKQVQSILFARIHALMNRDIEWRSLVLDSAMEAIKEMTRDRPDQLVALKRKKLFLESAIEKLMDRCETAEEDVSAKLRARLGQRCRELTAVEREIRRLMDLDERRARLPSREELEKRLEDWPKLLNANDSAAAIALRELIGPVTVHGVSIESSKKTVPCLRFRVPVNKAVGLVVPELSGGTGDVSAHGEEVEIVLRKIPMHEAIADEVQRLYAEGWKFKAMAERFGCHRDRIKQSLNYWRSQRGMPPIDARHERKRLPSKCLAVTLAERAKELWDRGLMMRNIAEQLGCDRGIATHAVQHWFRSRGLPTPNNQERRKVLGLGRAKNGQK